MKSLLEKSLAYTLGGIVGVVIGYSIVMSEFSGAYNSESCTSILITSIIFGVLFSIAFIENGESKNMRKNNQVRNEAIALITHEMRTGLTSTSWAIQMVLKKYGVHISNEDKDILNDVTESIQTTISHSVNLLDISVLDIGKLSLALENAGLEKIEKIFRMSLDKFKIGADKKDIKLVSTIDLDTSKKVEVDLVRLRIILENLLENALQYTTNDPKEIKVNISNNDKNLLISVSDTGIGIPASEQSKIFSEFYRAKNAKKVLSSGSGIGLYTCSQYVKAHNGTIRFESEENKGTKFFITIPLKTSADVDKFLDKI